MFKKILSIFKREDKNPDLPCEYGKWGWDNGVYKQRYCSKCGCRQVKRVSNDYLMESYCKELDDNTFKYYK
jgi:hypothetical protein